MCGSSLLAQFSFNANGTGIESPTNTASGNTSTAMGFKPKQVEIFRLLWSDNTTASGTASTAMGSFNKSK